MSSKLAPSARLCEYIYFHLYVEIVSTVSLSLSLSLSLALALALARSLSLARSLLSRFPDRMSVFTLRVVHVRMLYRACMIIILSI